MTAASISLFELLVFGLIVLAIVWAALFLYCACVLGKRADEREEQRAEWIAERNRAQAHSATKGN